MKKSVTKWLNLLFRKLNVLQMRFALRESKHMKMFITERCCVVCWVWEP